MLSRFLSKTPHLRLLTLITSKPQCPNPIHPPSQNPDLPFILALSRSLSSKRTKNAGNKDPSQSGTWSISPESDPTEDSIFAEDQGSLAGIADRVEEPWPTEEDDGGDVFASVDTAASAPNRNRHEEWATADGYKDWTLGDEEKDEQVFDIGELPQETSAPWEESFAEKKITEEEKQLLAKEEELKSALKGPNRAFGDLVAASGITNAMLDNLMALKEFEGVSGLPPLSEIEDMRYEKNTRKSSRAEIELQKQEEVAKARVRQVDNKGRAYGTGRRKCSIARVWVQPGEGIFTVNEKQFDVYFPDLDHRAALLRPFCETKTLGLWDVDCTVKGGGVSGQVGAIRLGISRALQNWEPGLRPALRDAGFLTRDARVVERKKPGKAKARKSFQWVKR